MNTLLPLATREIAAYLEVRLPILGQDWWQKNVVARLSFHQQRMVVERRYTTLKQLDLAALLRIFDQNWFELFQSQSLARDGRTWLRELQTVRNKWAHLPAEEMPPSEVYRDADTLARLLVLIGATDQALETVEQVKIHCVDAMARLRATHATGHSALPASSLKTASGHSDAVGGTVGTGEEGRDEADDCTARLSPLFNVGDLVGLRSDPHAVVPIIEIAKGVAEYRYTVFQNSAKATYYESQLRAPAADGNELLPLSASSLQARLTALNLLSPSTASLFSLHAGRIQFVPYQYRPVLKLVRADRPRLLIADEVGVGKTIEAGLIIKELRARTALGPVLIVCPKPLVAERKWLTEMKRFDEQFTALDGRLLRHCLDEVDLEGEWPEQYANAIVPFSLFDSDLVLGKRGQKHTRRSPGLLALDPPPKFGLVIVDEAHHIRNADTYLHQGIRYLCDNAEAVIFLSATPVQLGREDLFTLLNVLRPDLVIDQPSFELMAAPNGYINVAIEHCRSAIDGWQKRAHAALDEAAATEWGRLFLREDPAFQGLFDALQSDGISETERIGMLRSLEELYTFSGLINRTRRRDIGEFTTRKPETVEIAFTPAQKHLHDRLLEVVARILTACHGQQNVGFMMTTIRRQAASCLYGLAPLLDDMLAGKLDRLEGIEYGEADSELDTSFVDSIRSDVLLLLDDARHLNTYDPKIDAFVSVLEAKAQLHNNKALVFSTFRHTLAYLARHAEAAELRFGLVHGGVPDDERADLRRRFALPKNDDDALDVLLSSEVGCEGLDFQFCDLLINYDLPWNPMRVEQRIGRIDRYGQKSESVAIVNFITPGTVDADIYQRCLWRIGVFQHAIGGNEEILGEITAELHDIAESFVLTEEEQQRKLQQLADNGIRRIREEQELEAKQTALFGLNVPKPRWQQEVAEAENPWLTPDAVQRCVSTYIAERTETDTQHILGDKPAKTLRLNQDARARLLEDFRQLPRAKDPVSRGWEKWLKGDQSTLPVTFDQQAAAADHRLTHLWAMHPLVRQAAARLQPSEGEYTSVGVASTVVPSGRYPFALYRWRKQGVKADEVLTVISTEPSVEAHLMSLLQSAIDDEAGAKLDSAVFVDLDERHHAMWSSALADHIAENRLLVEHRTQSLSASHRARLAVLEEQSARAVNEKIRIMKLCEIARAQSDFDGRMETLKAQAAASDIHASPVLIGYINVGAVS